ncbi:OsmC/Ohr family [Triangularia setosa]|uniref:OsmC/Ohr family n=1 Tax=Triangularia setosa TaxID=2587417 RepID=A0AAN6W3Y6_9PEZI|nr:OsmC/Ohr family [Podospora setosa]
MMTPTTTVTNRHLATLTPHCNLTCIFLKLALQHTQHLHQPYHPPTSETNMFATRLTIAVLAPAARQAARRRFSTTLTRRQTLPVKVTGTGTGTLQKVSVPGKPYTFTADTYPVLGGTDSAPSPVVYSLASLSACNQVTGSVVANNHGINLGKWDVSVEAQLPTAVLVNGEQGNPNWESLKLSVRVQTDAEREKFDKFVSEVERRCPITQLFKLSGIRYESEWINEKL